MNYCPQCKVSVKGEWEYCPLCKSSLNAKETEEKQLSAFLNVPLEFNRDKAIQSFLRYSLIIVYFISLHNILDVLWLRICLISSCGRILFF